MCVQKIYSEEDFYKNIPDILIKNHIKKLCVVQGKSSKFEEFNLFITSSNLEIVNFSDFSSNPTTIEVERGIDLFQKEHCDGLLAVGGGSAIDVAKGIKAFVNGEFPYHYSKPKPCPIFFIAIPTTAGTGSESTDFAVIYEGQKKLSLYHPELLPDVVILEPRFLRSLPLYQKKCTMLDGLCQCIESYWSIHSTEESKELAIKGMQGVLNHKIGYLENQTEDLLGMLVASNLSGQAIRLTKTTAPHAMSYGLTSIYHIPHGHAVALCLPEVWEFMINDSENNEKDLSFRKLNQIVEFSTSSSISDKGVAGFRTFFKELQLPRLKYTTDSDFERLCNSVNAERLANNPIVPNQDTIRSLYQQIFNQK